MEHTHEVVRHYCHRARGVDGEKVVLLPVIYQLFRFWVTLGERLDKLRAGVPADVVGQCEAHRQPDYVDDNGDPVGVDVSRNDEKYRGGKYYRERFQRVKRPKHHRREEVVVRSVCEYIFKIPFHGEYGAEYHEYQADQQWREF